MKELIKTDKNGTKYFNERIICDRCGGDGVYKWGAMINNRPQFVGTCFKCNGAGKVWAVTKEYTPEYRAKLDAANEKRKEKQKAKWEAERAEREAEQMRIKAERAKREAERLAEIERNRGHFIGSVGDKLQMEVTLIRRFNYEVPHPVCDWKTQYMTGYIFKTDDGNTLVWKTSGSLGYQDSEKHMWICPDDGERLIVKGTIKAHKEFNNVNQTELSRVKWIH